MTKYNCNWVYSVFPTRLEFQVTDRDTGDILLDETYPVSNYTDEINSIKHVEEYVKVFKYETIYNKKFNTTNIIGKGTYLKEVN